MKMINICNTQQLLQEENDEENYEEIEPRQEKVSNIKQLINKHNSEGTNYPSKIDDWKKFEKNNTTTALNILKEIFIIPAYISRHNSKCKKQIILLMIPNEEKTGWYYLAVKRLSALLHIKTSKNKGGFHFLNCFHSFRTKNKLKPHEKVCKDKDFRRIVMPKERKKTLELNQYMKSYKMPFIIYADTESLIRKIDRCPNNPEKPSTMKIGQNIPCGYSMSTIWGFDHIGNKDTLYHEKDCMKKFCDSLKKYIIPRILESLAGCPAKVSFCSFL